MTRPLKRHDRVRVYRGSGYSQTGIVVDLTSTWAIVSMAGSAHATWGGPPSQCVRINPNGIGAVVAMVAAARMVLGGWSIKARSVRKQCNHWDFVSCGMSDNCHAACGQTWLGDNISPDIDDVDCPACLAIHARASGVKP